MSLILSGTDGLSDVDGSAATPAIRGTDANTGIFFPAADTIAFAEGGAEIARFDSSGNLGIGTSSPGNKLEVAGLIRATSLSNPSSGSGIEVGYDGTQGVIQAFSSRVTNTAVPINIQGDLKMNSGYGSSVIAYGCRAWVSFNGTGTVAIRGSGNVSSITDVGTGSYVVNYTTAMPDANYSCSSNAVKGGGAISQANSVGVYYREDRVLAASIEMYTMSFSGTAVDPLFVMATIIR